MILRVLRGTNNAWQILLFLRNIYVRWHFKSILGLYVSVVQKGLVIIHWIEKKSFNLTAVFLSRNEMDVTEIQLVEHFSPMLKAGFSNPRR